MAKDLLRDRFRRRFSFLSKGWIAMHRLGEHFRRRFSFLWKFANYCWDIHERFAAIIIAHPILFIPAFIPYAVFTLLNLVTSVSVFFLIRSLAVIVSPANPEGFQIAMAVLPFLFLEIAILGDYLLLGIRCFASVAEFNGYARPILRVLQLVFITVLIFAGVHYYVAALSHEQAYHGLTVFDDDKLKWLDSFDRLTSIPSWDTVLDAVYFSTVTMATVGYGDIFPVSKYAKLATIVQIIFSFVLVVVLLGWAVGNAKELAVRQQKKVPGTDAGQKNVSPS